MAENAIRFGVVGLGMGGHHCLAIEKTRGAVLTAVCDKDPERLAHTSQKFGVRGYAAYSAMLNDPEIDVISIVTESGNHAEMGIAAAKAGKHIVVEKPVDITPARINRLEEVVRRTGVKCGCIFQSRMNPCIQAIKKAMVKGKMGRLIGLHGSLPWYRSMAYFSGPFGPWRGTWAMDGGGSMMNQGIHTVDLLIYLGGPVERVCGFYDVFDHAIEAEDQTVACLQFSNGALGTITTTTCARPEGAQIIYGYGSKGSFRKEGDSLTLFEMGGAREREQMLEQFGGKKTSDAAGADPMAVGADGHCLIMEDMVQAIRKDREPAIPLAQARHAVEVVCAIYQAAKQGKTVAVKNIRGFRSYAG